MKAAIFDMDGVLVDSEPLWRLSEMAVSERFGLGLEESDLDASMGMRMDEAVRCWHARVPWDGVSLEDVEAAVISEMEHRLLTVTALPGVRVALDRLRARGVRLALCSSSSSTLIAVVLNTLGLMEVFEVVHSAEHDAYGKPHPDPYLTTASELGVAPGDCIAIEDSVNGAISARAAGMKVVAVPARSERGSGRFGFADLVLESLVDLDDTMLNDVAMNRRIPNASRPRFHLAFPVHDLDAARAFYGGVLGCPEGRSSKTWVDFDLEGHQIVAHLAKDAVASATNEVDGHAVPASHMGIVSTLPVWRRRLERLRQSGTVFLMEPTLRFEGTVGEQYTFFVSDPSGNALEFKAFREDRQVFSARDRSQE